MVDQILWQDRLEIRDIKPQDGQVRIDAAETGRALEGGSRVETITQVDEQGARLQSIGPRQERRLLAQDEVVDTAKSIEGRLSACGLALWFFGNTLVWHGAILSKGD
ncbi:MAG TPA: hypothetical protein VGK56_18875 [Anaerolineales bacterium]